MVLVRSALIFVAVSLVGQTSAHAPESTLRRIQELLQNGDKAGAREQIVSALKEYPLEPVLHNFLGVLEAQQGEYRKAESSFRKAIQLSPGYAGAYLNLGRLYQENIGQDPDAVKKGIAAYRGVLRRDPASVEANYQVAVLLQREGLFRESLEHLNNLPAEVQEKAQALALRCAAQAASGDAAAGETAQRLLGSADLSESDITSILPALAKTDDLALRLLEGLDRRRLASAGSIRLLAGLHEKREKLPDARRTYERAAQAAGKVTPDLLVDLARVAFKEKDWEGALSYLAHARDLAPNDAAIHFFFGMVTVEMDLPVEAEKSLRKALELKPENPYYNYALGAVVANSRKWKEAALYFETFCREKPDDARGKLALASAYFHSFETEKARKLLEEVIDKPETAPGAHYHLGLLAIQENDFPSAIRQLEKAVELNPRFAEAYAELGFARMQAEDFDNARKALERSLELAPEGQRGNMVLLSLYQRTDDPRAEAQAKRYEELETKKAERIKLLLRTIEARPY